MTISNNFKIEFLSKEIKVIIFDFDDTLVDGELWITKRWKKTINHIESQYKINHFSDVFWEVFNEHGPFYKYHVNDTCEILDIEQYLVPIIVKRFHETKVEEKLFFDVLDCLKILQKKYLLGMITNGNESIQIERLEKLKIKKYFSDIICAYNFPKPSNKPFKKCIKFFGLDPTNFLYIGDDYEKDYLPAKKNGMNSVLIKRTENSYSNLNVPYICDLTELFSY
tara:strand:- start:612 stop:1283 length:672 start_codon:yes stop_codon:yes gene_type:complete